MLLTSFCLFTDSSANLPAATCAKRNIRVLPLTLLVNDEKINCADPGDLGGDAFYERLRHDSSCSLKTSMINSHTFMEAFEPVLSAGEDVLYVGMSSGISGTVGAAESAARELSARYPDRDVLVVDTFAASLGEGMQVLEGAALRDEGISAKDAAAYLLTRRLKMRQYFVVDDLMFLKRGGRLSTGAALAGTLINIKPILKGDAQGRIVLTRKLPGRKKAIRALLELFENEWVEQDSNLSFSIAHGGCEADAKALAEEIQRAHPSLDCMVECYEVGTGAHVGPGTIALFFWGAAKNEETSKLGGIGAHLAAEAALLRARIQARLKL